MSEEIQLPKNTESAKTKETIPQLFGKNVRKYRTLKKLTQEQLSEKLSISQKHLSIIETGAQFASASLIQRISEVLEVSPGDLFGGSQDDLKKEISKSRDMIMTMFLNEIRHKSAGIESLLNEIKNSIQKNNNHSQSPFDIDSEW